VDDDPVGEEDERTGGDIRVTNAIISYPNLVCKLCGRSLRVISELTGANYTHFLVEHGGMPEALLNQDIPLEFCPNNCRIFDVFFQHLVAEHTEDSTKQAWLTGIVKEGAKRESSQR
jgi:hypothetical protein